MEPCPTYVLGGSSFGEAQAEPKSKPSLGPRSNLPSIMKGMLFVVLDLNCTSSTTKKNGKRAGTHLWLGFSPSILHDFGFSSVKPQKPLLTPHKKITAHPRNPPRNPFDTTKKRQTSTGLFGVARRLGGVQPAVGVRQPLLLRHHPLQVPRSRLFGPRLRGTEAPMEALDWLGLRYTPSEHGSSEASVNGAKSSI